MIQICNKLISIKQERHALGLLLFLVVLFPPINKGNNNRKFSISDMWYIKYYKFFYMKIFLGPPEAS